MSRLDQLLKLVALDPRDPMTHYGLGLEYLKLERFDDAIRAFDGALAADGKYSTAYYHKARTQAAAGRPGDARATLQTGIAVAQSAGDWHAKGEMEELLTTLD